MRGALLADRLDPRPGGIIPAYAGSTTGYKPGDFIAEDHPRVCGEHLTAALCKPFS